MHPTCVLPEVAEHVEGVLVLFTVIQPARQLALLICGTGEMAGPHPSTGKAGLTSVIPPSTITSQWLFQT